MSSKSIVHRDLKLANILLHFPNIPKFDELSSLKKRKFLNKVDLTKVEFELKIGDFGLSTIYDSHQSVLSIVGTPLYSSPQVLNNTWYDETVDTWALGCILFELINGMTQFQGKSEEELIQMIKDGRYKAKTSD